MTPASSSRLKHLALAAVLMAVSAFSQAQGSQPTSKHAHHAKAHAGAHHAAHKKHRLTQRRHTGAHAKASASGKRGHASHAHHPVARKPAARHPH